MLDKALGTDRRGTTVLIGIGATLGLVLAVSLFLSYGVGAGYLVSFPTPWNVVAALAILLLAAALSVALIRRALQI